MHNVRDSSAEFDCSVALMDRIANIRKERGWNVVPYYYLEFMRTFHNWQVFVTAITNRPDICSNTLDSEFWVDACCTEKHSLESLFPSHSAFSEVTLLYGNITHPGLEPCSGRGWIEVSCGFSLSVCKRDEKITIRLDTGFNGNLGLHFHKEFEEKNLHLVLRNDDGFYFPISWHGRPKIVNNRFTWDTDIMWINPRYQYWFVVLISL